MRLTLSTAGAVTIAAALAPGAAEPAAAAWQTVLSEDFATDPIANGRAVEVFDSGRYAYNPSGSIDTAVDTTMSTGKLRWDLDDQPFSEGRTLTEQDTFRFQVDFTVGQNLMADGFGQIAFGLTNSSTTGPDRVGTGPKSDAYDLMTVDYFPISSDPSLTPTVIGSANGESFFSRINAPFGPESQIDGAGETGPLPTGQQLTAELTYRSGTRQLTVELTDADGNGLPINADGGGPDGDPSTVQHTLPAEAGFHVDSFTLPLWFDPDHDASFSGPVTGNVNYGRFAVQTPEPSTALLLVGPAAGLLMRRRRRQ